MKKQYKTLAVTLAILVSIAADAKTDVTGALQQLKTNEDNSKANYKQYNDNAEVASKNIVEVTAAIKTVRDQKTQLNTNAQNLEKNRAILDQMKAKLEGYKGEESQHLKREEAQIQQLKATLDKLQTNAATRTQNLEAYNQKIAEIEKEKADWNQQKQAFAQIQKELEVKEAKAMTEREKWIEKRKGYRDEAGKWQKESEVAEQQRIKFDKLK